jgi:hypothetical protein
LVTAISELPISAANIAFFEEPAMFVVFSAGYGFVSNSRAAAPVFRQHDEQLSL